MLREAVTAWNEIRVVAYLWWCGDDVCDCTQPCIDQLSPNRQAGYPWIHRDNLWSGKFITDSWEYSPEDRERLHYAPLREECQRRGIPIPAFALPPTAEDPP